VVPRKDLVHKVLGRGLEPFDRSIDVHVSSLRKKLGHKTKGIERIRTIRGIGYMYALLSLVLAGININNCVHPCSSLSD
jgi:two-component system response regulator CpxR